MVSTSSLGVLALLVLIGYLSGAGCGLVLGHMRTRLGTRLALLCALFASTVTVLGALPFWQQPMSEGMPIATLATGLPGGFPPIAIELFIDRLAIFFLLLTNLLAIAVTIYSFTWLEGAWKPHRVAGVYNIFLLAVITLLVVNSVYLFLLALESVTLSFAYLVLYRHNRLLEKPAEETEAREMADAGLAYKTYLIFSHTGAILIMLALLVLALLHGKDGFDFDVLREPRFEHSSQMTSQMASLIFLLAVAGFGIKGGFAGAHPWVPMVHPYSPTTTHALTLGFVIKAVSFYMLIRVCFQFLAPVQLWWGLLLLIVAGATALIGVFYAIGSRDLKTALANHSIENIGIMLAGVGIALVMLAPMFKENSTTLPLPLAVAQVGLVASFYHMLNHGIFKSLLYLCTGAIEHRTGVVDMDRLGGVITAMPWTATAFLIGALAISGFPPFNGFISKWLTIQALLIGLGSPPRSDSSALLLPLAIVAVLMTLGLAFALTAFAFVKIVGETLLGAPRDPEVAARSTQGEAPWLMRGVELVMAILCLLLGTLPGLVVQPLALMAQDLLAHEQQIFEPIFEPGGTAITLHLPQPKSDEIGLDLGPVLLLAIAPLALAILIAARNRRASRRRIWTGGAAYRPEWMQITGGAFAFMVWNKLGRRWTPDEAANLAPDERIPWRLALSAHYYIPDHFRRLFAAGVERLLTEARRLGDRVQNGDIRWYLFYLFLAFLTMLILSGAGK